MSRARRVIAPARLAARPVDTARAGARPARAVPGGGVHRPSAPGGLTMRTMAFSMRAASAPLTNWPQAAASSAWATVPRRAGRNPALRTLTGAMRGSLRAMRRNGA